MAIERVKEYFSRFGMEDKVMEFPVSSATVELAARALNCEPGRIAKTLSFKLKNANKAILIVTAGDARINNAKYKAVFGEKAFMLTPDEAIRDIGHAVGGVCPFAVKDGVAVYLDVSLERFTTVFPACGSANSAIELTPSELAKYADCVEWIDVCKDWQSEAAASAV